METIVFKKKIFFLRYLMYSTVRVKLLGEYEVGGGAGDGDESADGRGVGDAECQTFTDHVIPLGRIL